MPAPDYAVELQQLRQGLASGEATIESDGDRVTYRNVDDIRKAISYFENEAAKASPASSGFGFTVAAFRR